MIRTIFQFVLCFLVAAIVTAHAEELPEPKFRIGVIAPLSGQVSSFGNYVRNGILLAQKNLPQELKGQIEITFEDDQFKPTNTVTAFQKLLAQGDADVFLLVGSGTGNAVAPINEKKRVPMIAIGASDSNVVKGGKYSFLHWVSPEAEAKIFAEEIKRRQYKRLAIIHAEHVGLNAVYNGVLSQLSASGLRDIIVLDEVVMLEQTDFSSNIAKIRAAQVDGICIMLAAGSLSTFTKLARQQKIKADFFSIEVFEDEAEVRAAAGTLDNQWYVSGDAGEQSFADAYKAEFGIHPGWAASNAYDSFNLMVEAYKNAGKDPDRIAQYLATVKDYHGAAGVYSASGDQRFTLPAVVKVVTKDGFQKLER